MRIIDVDYYVTHLGMRGNEKLPVNFSMEENFPGKNIHSVLLLLVTAILYI